MTSWDSSPPQHCPLRPLNRFRWATMSNRVTTNRLAMILYLDHNNPSLHSNCLPNSWLENYSEISVYFRDDATLSSSVCLSSLWYLWSRHAAAMFSHLLMTTMKVTSRQLNQLVSSLIWLAMISSSREFRCRHWRNFRSNCSCQRMAQCLNCWIVVVLTLLLLELAMIIVYWMVEGDWKSWSLAN